MAVSNVSSTNLLVEKLRLFKSSLSDAEQVIFKTLIESAAEHAQMLQANDDCSASVALAKPKSVPGDMSVKSQLVGLPAQLFSDQIASAKTACH